MKILRCVAESSCDAVPYRHVTGLTGKPPKHC